MNWFDDQSNLRNQLAITSTFIGNKLTKTWRWRLNEYQFHQVVSYDINYNQSTYQISGT